jgi:hypothetical protein
VKAYQSMRKLFRSKRSSRPHSTILEAHAIESVLEHTKNSDTMVIFDIDNTLVHTNKELGSDPWAYWFVKEKLKEGMMPRQALAYMFDLFRHIHSHVDIYPVEEKTVSIVQKLKDLEVPTICLTGRQSSMIDVTQEQMKKAGFVLNSPENLTKSLTLRMKHPVEMANGIICGGMNEKGDVLAKIFKTLNFKSPEVIVFVDDKLNCVESMSKQCSENNIAFTGLRYGYMDPIVANFDPQKAQEQLEELLKRHALVR